MSDRLLPPVLRHLALPLLIASAPVLAADGRAATQMFVERDTSGAGVRLVPLPPRLRSGDRVIVVVSVEPRTGLTIVNAVPSTLRFVATRGRSAALSVDGGRSYGRLATLTVLDDAGRSRPASGGDVTHLRWDLSPLREGRATLSFRAVVR